MRSPKEKPKRRYQSRLRAEKKSETHRALARAAFELHDTIGPLRTTISAIAQRAGVQRLTVYRHFPDDAAIFSACTAYSFELDPPPDPEKWGIIVDPEARLRTALIQLFGYYRRKRRLLANLYRDAEMPVVAAALARGQSTMQRGVDVLAADRTASAGDVRMLRAAIGHVLEFSTWLSFTEVQGLSDLEAIDFATSIVTGRTV